MSRRLCCDKRGLEGIGRADIGLRRAGAHGDPDPRAGKVDVTSIDGEAAAASILEPLMREAGFGVSPKGLVIWPERRGSATA